MICWCSSPTGTKRMLGQGDGFADGGGGGGVVLAALAAHAVGSVTNRAMSLTVWPMLTEQSRPVVGAGAGFHADPGTAGAGQSGPAAVQRPSGLINTALPFSSTP